MLGIQACVEGFYSREFLESAGFVIVDRLRFPDTPQVRASGLLDQLGGHGLEGITYNDTYYLLRGAEDCKCLHFLELVHVAQWQILGPYRFIADYAEELSIFGYSSGAPLERMARNAEEHYAAGHEAYDVVQNVKSRLVG